MSQRLTPKEVRQIVKLYHEGWGYRSISRIVGIREQRVENILNGTYYTNVTGGRVSNGKRPGKDLQIYNGRK